MGGDYAPGVVIEGLALTVQEYPDYDYILVGHKEKVEFYLEKYGLAGNPHITVHHAETVCEMSDPSAIALRGKKNSSITTCARLLKDGLVDAMVTPGHTGATVAATKVILRTLPGVDRPALGANMPNQPGRFLLMDAGANPDCTALNLEQFAIMGEIYAQYLFKKDRPTVGLLSVGGEDIKGCDLTKEAFKRLERLPINFIGNVEADTVFEGGTDVLVSDGFAGNVLLKCAEGLAKSTFVWLKRVLKKNTLRYVWAMMAQNVFRELKAFGDADNVGGAPLLGINGICIIGHGSSNPKAVLNAIRVAAECVNFRLNEKIVAGIKAANEANAKLAAEQTGN